MALPFVSLPHYLKERLLQGHPWVYRDQIVKPAQYPSGTWVRVRCGTFEAFGLWEAQGAIAIRIFSRERIPNQEWIETLVRQAWDIRDPLRAAGVTAYRWIYGESDGLPAIVVDLYGEFAVVSRYSPATASLLPWIVEALRRTTPLRGIVERSPDRDGLTSLWGSLPPRQLVVEEHGLRFVANLYEGQKTGLFLDQRENRRFLEHWCRGKEVLDCFSYTGAFSLYAAKGGARQITSCDLSPAAIADAIANFRLNHFDPDAHVFLTEDIFTLLDRFHSERRLFDVIILDPPSFARSRKSRFTAQRAYVKLNRAALGCLRPGGLLATASCTSQITPDMFKEALAQAGALARKRLIILHEAGHALDHPVPAGFPEGRYLKFVLARAVDWR